jgi:DNA-binding FrmR family transcriptional regulator
MGILCDYNNTIMVITGDSMKDVILRLKRVGGQVEGLVRMIEREEECSQIITQFQAAKAALDNTFSLVLQRNLKECVNHDDSKSVEKILKLITKQ